MATTIRPSTPSAM